MTVLLTSGLERGTADEETIDIGFLADLSTVLLCDTTTVQDTSLIGDLIADVLLQPLTDGLVHLLSLLSGGDFAAANCPERLVGDDNLGPVGDLGLESSELVAHDLNGLAALALLDALTAAPDDVEAVLGGELGFGGNNLVALLENCAALRVTQDGPVDVAVLELGDRDLACESAVGLVEDVLGSDFDGRAEVFANELEVQSGRGDDDLCRSKHTVSDIPSLSCIGVPCSRLLREATMGEPRKT